MLAELADADGAGSASAAADGANSACTIELLPAAVPCGSSAAAAGGDVKLIPVAISAVLPAAVGWEASVGVPAGEPVA